MLDYDVVKYKNKKYAIICVKYNNKESDIIEDLPIIIDYTDLDTIKDLDKKWRYNKHGRVSCIHTYKGKVHEVYLHEIITTLKYWDEGLDPVDKPIIHINKIGLDNRRINLFYDTKNKNVNKNVVKKKRTIVLPKECGVNIKDIPTYVWYMKPNGSHGERFMVHIGGVKWKTTSSKKYSLKYKLEEAKKFMRDLMVTNPDLFELYSMNGDFNKMGKNLINSYFDIIHLGGYSHIPRYIHKNRTPRYLKPGDQSDYEKALLNMQNDLSHNTNKNRRVKNNLPVECGITSNDLPKYCYYKSPYNKRGGYFIIDNHPKLNKMWRTTSSKKVSSKSKYKHMLKKLKEIVTH